MDAANFCGAGMTADSRAERGTEASRQAFVALVLARIPRPGKRQHLRLCDQSNGEDCCGLFRVFQDILPLAVDTFVPARTSLSSPRRVTCGLTHVLIIFRFLVIVGSHDSKGTRRRPVCYRQ